MTIEAVWWGPFCCQVPPVGGVIAAESQPISQRPDRPEIEDSEAGTQGCSSL